MIDLVLDRSDLDRKLDRLGIAVTDWTIPARQLDAGIKADIGREWANNGKARGGTVRGEDWAGFADQYTRKDGSVVPAWGDERAKGRKRPSGKPVTESSIIGQDAGRFRRALLASKANIRNKNELIIGGESLPDYAEHVDALRPIVRAIPKDQQLMDRVTNAYLEDECSKASR